MKKSLWVIMLTLACIVLFVIFILRTKDASDSNRRHASTIEKDTRVDQPWKHHPEGNPVLEESRLKSLTRIVEMANVPIEFYGLVVDQDGAPIPNASVEWRVTKAGYFSSSTPGVKGSISTNNGGLFSVLEQSGQGLSIEKIAKKGYRQPSSNYASYGFGGLAEPHIPNSKTPVVYLLVKEEVPRAKYFGEQSIRPVWGSGTEHVKIGDGNIEILISATRNRKPDQNRGFEWILNISMDGGKLLEIDSATSLAPLDGYVNNLSFGFKSNDVPWKAGFNNKRIAFKTKEGQYGRLDADFYANREDDKVALYIETRVNLSGKRNLD